MQQKGNNRFLFRPMLLWDIALWDSSDHTQRINLYEKTKHTQANFLLDSNITSRIGPLTKINPRNAKVITLSCQGRERVNCIKMIRPLSRKKVDK